MRFTVAILLAALVVASPATAGRIESQQASAKVAICQVFGPDCKAALAVAWCESKWYIWAQNGQYRGLFQMGSWERATYGHGPGAYAQARAAYRYFVASGRDWSPWSCRWAI
jgi:hypothetical protein